MKATYTNSPDRTYRRRIIGMMLILGAFAAYQGHSYPADPRVMHDLGARLRGRCWKTPRTNPTLASNLLDQIETSLNVPADYRISEGLQESGLTIPGGFSLTDEEISALNRTPFIRFLVLHTDIQLTSRLQQVKKLRHIRSLTFEGLWDFGDADLLSLSQSRSLNKLGFESCVIDRELMETIDKLPHVRYVEFRSCIFTPSIFDVQLHKRKDLAFGGIALPSVVVKSTDDWKSHIPRNKVKTRKSLLKE